MAALSITGLGAESCGVSVPISLIKIAVLSSMYTSPNQLMIGLSEVCSSWINLSRWGVPIYPIIISSARGSSYISSRASSCITAFIIIESKTPLGNWRTWYLCFLFIVIIPCRIPINDPAALFSLFPFPGLPTRGQISPFVNHIDCGILRQNWNLKGSRRILSSISGPSRLHSTFRYMISYGRFSVAFGNSVIGLPFLFRNPMLSR